MLINELDIDETDIPFSFENVWHIQDMCAVSGWFMPREAEMASSRMGHLTLEVRLMIPLHKTDTVGTLAKRATE